MGIDVWREWSDVIGSVNQVYITKSVLVRGHGDPSIISACNERKSFDSIEWVPEGICDVWCNLWVASGDDLSDLSVYIVFAFEKIFIRWIA